MGTTISKRSSVRGHSRRQRKACELQAWYVSAAVVAGTWAAAGINREVIDGEIAGYWKQLDCGCLVIVELVR
jgi:hypothetical protein